MKESQVHSEMVHSEMYSSSLMLHLYGVVLVRGVDSFPEFSGFPGCACISSTGAASALPRNVALCPLSEGGGKVEGGKKGGRSKAKLGSGFVRFYGVAVAPASVAGLILSSSSRGRRRRPATRPTSLKHQPLTLQTLLPSAPFPPSPPPDNPHNPHAATT